MILIGAFFREIDRADELGSGMRKMMMYGKSTRTGPAAHTRRRECFSHDYQRAGVQHETGQETVDPVQVRVHDGVHDIRLTETMKKILVLLVERKSTPQLLAAVVVILEELVITKLLSKICLTLS